MVQPPKRSTSLMQSFNSFRHMLVRSLTDLNYYVDVLNSPLKRSLKLIGLFYVLLGLVLTIIFTLTTFPDLKSDVLASVNTAIEQFPADRQYTWTGSQLESNQTEPVVIPFPENVNLPVAVPNNLAVLDTGDNAQPNESTAALFFVNQEQLFVNTQTGAWSPTQLDQLFTSQQLVINRQQLQAWQPIILENVESTLNVLPFVMFFVFSLGLFLTRLVLMAIDSIIVQFMFMLMNKQLPYRKVYQLSLHLLVPVELLTQAKNLLYPQLDFSMTTIAYWALIALLLWHLRNLHVLKFTDQEKKTK